MECLTLSMLGVLTDGINTPKWPHIYLLTARQMRLLVLTLCKAH